MKTKLLKIGGMASTFGLELLEKGLLSSFQNEDYHTRFFLKRSLTEEEKLYFVAEYQWCVFAFDSKTEQDYIFYSKDYE